MISSAVATDAAPRLTVDAIEAALARGEAAEILLPLVGITLLPPWWWLILWAGKRIENRAPSVAGRLQGWTGLIALTSSKPSAAAWEIAVIEARQIREERMGTPWVGPASWTLAEAKVRSGYVIGVAELLGVQDNDRAAPDPWAVPGQRGLLLGRVLEVEPIPCSGGRGVFRFGACKGCGKPGAIENKGAPLVCRACKTSTPFAELGRPALKVRSVQPQRAAL